MLRINGPSSATLRRMRWQGITLRDWAEQNGMKLVTISHQSYAVETPSGEVRTVCQWLKHESYSVRQRLVFGR